MSETGTDVVQRPAMPEELLEVRQLGDWLAKAERDDRSPESLGAAAALRTYYARQLFGVENPLAANELSFHKGRLIPSTKLLRALASKHGFRVVSIECDDVHCIAAVIRMDTGEELGRSLFTIEMAQRQGLVRDGSAYKKVPDRMMWARAAKRALDEFAPEAMLGVAARDEGEYEEPPESYVEAEHVELEPEPDERERWEAEHEFSQDDDIPFTEEEA
jgi:hypothetical protein